MTSLKVEIETWAAALQAYDAQDYDRSLHLFAQIADHSKIFTNIGLIHASLGEHEVAVNNFRAATSLDSYLGIAYFQAGVSNFLIGRFGEALVDFEQAFQVLRGHEAINYEQIGLKYQLHGASVLFNQGITLINMGEPARGMQVLQEALEYKTTEDHDVITDAIRDRGEGYSVFCIPVGILYRPNEKKIANMRARDWLGKAKLISATDSKDEFITFTGSSNNTTTRAAPVRPDPPPPEAGLGRSRSAVVVASQPRNFNDGSTVARIGRSATVGAPRPSTAPETQALSPPQALNLAAANGRVKQPLRVVNNTPTKDSGPRAPPMARRPTLKVNNEPSESERERPVTPPNRQVSSSPEQTAYSPSSSSSSPKARRILDAIEAEDTITKKPLYGCGKAAQIPPVNVPQDVEMMIDDVYDGYLNAGDEEYFSGKTKGSKRNQGGVERERQLNSLQEETTTPPLMTRPVRSNTLPNLPPASAFDAGSSTSSSGTGSVVGGDKIRLKLYFKDEIRAMVVSPSITYSDLYKRVCDKLEQAFGRVRVKFEDEDGTKVTIRDDEDWEMAVNITSMRGDGKLPIWCEEE